MIDYDLPTSVSIGGREYPIRTDFRPILDILTAMNDPELTDADRATVALRIFYEDEVPDDGEAAIRECMRFIAGGVEQPNPKPAPKLVDWEKDFRWIASPINRMLGRDIRGMKMHWWTFLGYYYEIGDCTFAQIVKIRNAKMKGKKLDKSDQEWLRQNADLVFIDQKTTQEEDNLLALWTKGGTSSAE